MPTEPLYMHQLRLNPRALFTLGTQLQCLPRGSDIDQGYLVHCALTGLFDTLAPKPFVIQPQRDRSLSVLAYSPTSGDALRQQAHTYAEPQFFDICDVARIASKAMPSQWPTGHRLGFEVRLCPVVRTARSGVERDAFLAHVARSDSPAAREVVYTEWLHHHLDRSGAVTLEESRMIRLRRCRLTRRRADRRASTLERPDIIMRGTFTVRDSAAFHTLLTRGIGRHRAFGFGMLLLRADTGEG